MNPCVTYLRRETVCMMLRLGLRQSYRIVGSSYGDRISSAEVVDILNRSRRSIPNPLETIPSDIMTTEEIEKLFAASDITKHDLDLWIHRTRNAAPHFRLNSHTIRFSSSRLEKWLDERSRIRRRT